MKRIATISALLLLAASSALLLARARIVDLLVDDQNEVWTGIVVGLPYTAVHAQLTGFAMVVPPDQAPALWFKSNAAGDQREYFLHGTAMIRIVGKDDRVTDIEVAKLEFR